MTVKIGDMRATFSNADVIYVAVGMHVFDNGSSSDSKLLNLTTNNNSKFSISKTGATRISANESDFGKDLFSILNYSSNVTANILNVTADVFKVQTNTVIVRTDTYINKTAYIQSYTEGYSEVTTSNSHLIIDLNKASVFTARSTNNYVSRITFIKPTMSVINNIEKSHSCTVIFKDIRNIPNTAWSNSNVLWAGATYPRDGGNTFILTFLNVSSDNTWLGITSGLDFRTV